MNELKPIAFTENVLAAPEIETVCYCAGVTKAAGARTLAEIKAATGASTQGRCRETSPRGR